jgi:hypothetical protein
MCTIRRIQGQGFQRMSGGGSPSLIWGLLVTAAAGAGEDRVADGDNRLVGRMAWVVPDSNGLNIAGAPSVMCPGAVTPVRGYDGLSRMEPS